MRNRAVPLAFVLFDAGVAFAAILVGRGETIQPARNLVTAACIAAWWTVPAVGLILFRTDAGTVATGAALLAGSAAALLSIYASTSSTAAIGFLTVPLLRACFVAACRILEAVPSWLHRAR